MELQAPPALPDFSPHMACQMQRGALGAQQGWPQGSIKGPEGNAIQSPAISAAQHTAHVTVLQNVGLEDTGCGQRESWLGIAAAKGTRTRNTIDKGFGKTTHRDRTINFQTGTHP